MTFHLVDSMIALLQDASLCNRFSQILRIDIGMYLENRLSHRSNTKQITKLSYSTTHAHAQSGSPGKTTQEGSQSIIRIIIDIVS
jgi:hypothetical protein